MKFLGFFGHKKCFPILENLLVAFRSSNQSFAINLLHKEMPFTGEDIYN